MKTRVIDPRTCPAWQLELMQELYRLDLAAGRALLAGDLPGALTATVAHMDVLCKLRRCLVG